MLILLVYLQQHSFQNLILLLRHSFLEYSKFTTTHFFNKLYNIYMSSSSYLIEVLLLRVEDPPEAKICLASSSCVIPISCEAFRAAAGRANCGLLFCPFTAPATPKWQMAAKMQQIDLLSSSDIPITSMALKILLHEAAAL